MRVREIGVLLAILLGSAVWQASGLTSLHGWSDDGSLYLRHAENLLAGRPYSSVLHGQTPSVGWTMENYPPGLPLTLAPLLAWRGLDWMAFQWAMWFWYVAALAAVAAAVWRIARPWETVAVLAIMAARFEYSRLASHINSDFPFLLAQALALALIPHTAHASWWRAVAAGLAGGCAYALRGTGLFLVAGGALHSWWRWGRWTRFAAISTLIAVGCMGAQTVLAPGGGAYLQVLRSVSWMTLRRNWIQLPLELGGVVWPAVWLAPPLLLLGVFGLWRLLVDERRPAWFAFAALYLPVVLIWPYSDAPRFLLPLMPLWLLALVRGAGTLARGAWLPGLLVAAALLAQFRAHLDFRRNPPVYGLNDPAALAAYQYLKDSLPAGALIACRKPRTVSLFTGRPSLVYSLRLPPAAVRTDICASGATHLFSAPDVFPDDRRAIAPFLAELKPKPLFTAGPYAVYDLGPICNPRP
jgi:hypothetical protein